MAIMVEHLQAKVDIDTGKAHADLKAFQAAVAELASHRYDVEIKVKTDKNSLTSAARDLNKVEVAATQAMGTPGGGGGRGGRGVQGLSSGMAGFRSRGAGLGLVKIAGMIEGITAVASPAVTSINALGAGVLGLAGHLGPVSGLLATIPQGIAGIGQTATAAIVGITGINKALEQVNEAKTFEEQERALERLTPGMRELVQEIRTGLMPSLRATQSLVAEGLVAGFNDATKSAEPFITMIRQQLTQTAGVIGSVSAEFAKMLSGGDFMQDFRTIAADNNKNLRVLAGGAMDLTSALTDLMVAARPLTTWLVESAGAWAKSISLWAEAGRESGRLGEFFEKTRDSTEDLMEFLHGTWDLLVNIGKAAAPLGQEVMRLMNAWLDRSNEWFDNAKNMKAAQQGFMDLLEPLRALARLAGDLGRAWLELNNNAATTRLLDMIGDKLVPSLVEMGKAVQESFGPVVIDSLASFADVLATIMEKGGTLSTLVNIVGTLAEAIDYLVEHTGALGTLGISMLSVAGAGKILAGVTSKVAIGLMGTTTAGKGFSAWLKGDGKSAMFAGGIAIAGLATAWSMYTDMMNEARAAGQSMVDDLRRQFDTKAPTMSVKELHSAISALNFDISKMEQEHAGTQAGPLGAKAREQLDAQIAGAVELRKEWNALLSEAWAVADATGLAENAAMQHVIALRAQGSAATGATLALKVYRLELRSVNAEVQTAASALEVAKDNLHTQRDLAVGLRESVAAANRDLADAQEALSEAQAAAAPDTRALTDAMRAQAEAAVALSESYHLAAEHLEDLRFAARGAVLSEARAVNALADAQDHLSDIQRELNDVTEKGARSTYEITKVTDDFTGKVFEVARVSASAVDNQQSLIDIQEEAEDQQRAMRDALLAVAEAQLGLDQARDKATDTQAELAEAERKGIMQSDLVVAARLRLEDANYAVVDAQEAITEAVKANEQAVIDAQQSVTDAAARVKAANEDLRAHMAGPMKDAVQEVTRAEARLVRKTERFIELLQQLPGLLKTAATEMGLVETAATNLGSDIVAGVMGMLPWNNREGGGVAGGGGGGAGGGSYADGGPAHGGVIRVGERGPENIYLGRQSAYVETAAATRRKDNRAVGMSNEQIKEMFEAIVAKTRPIDIDVNAPQHANPQHIANEIAWKVVDA